MYQMFSDSVLPTLIQWIHCTFSESRSWQFSQNFRIEGTKPRRRLYKFTNVRFFARGKIVYPLQSLLATAFGPELWTLNLNRQSELLSTQVSSYFRRMYSALVP